MVLVKGYSLDQALYEGAQCAVYRGTRDSDGVPVVCKLMSAEYPTSNELSSFRREYEIGTRLRGQGTVGLYALEESGKGLAIVMEDIGAEALDRDASLSRSGLEEKLLVACGIVEALVPVHRAGIIHKDINPSNIVRNRESGIVKIIDFGIAAELARESASIQAMGMLEGTPAYISPEQTGRMNRPMDYRTDFYSLGATLYELFAGRVPFPGGDVLELVHAHLAKVPVSPGDIVPGLPEAVSAIILKLLAKAPEDRYQGLGGILGDLRRCRLEWEEQGEISNFPVGATDRSDRFAIPAKLYGREPEIAALGDALREARGGPPRLFLVGGGTGTGKTSLIREIQRSLLSGNGLLATGKFDQLGANVPYSALIQAFRDLLDQLLCFPAETVDRVKAGLLAELGANAGLLSELVPNAERLIGRHDPPPPLDPAAAHNRLQLVIRQFVQAVARDGRPLVVFLDDLQWGDQPTMEAVKYLLGGESVRNLLLVGAYREGEVGEGHPLARLIKALDEGAEGEEAPYRRLSLGPMGIDDLKRLLADTLRGDPEETAALAAIIQKKTGGNPFFINQTISSLYARGAFAYDAGEDLWRWDPALASEAGLGDNVVDFLVRRLGTLSGPATEVLKIASCVGDDFDLGTLAAVYGEGAASLSGGLWEALEREIVIPLNRDYRLLNLKQGGFDPASLDVVLKFSHDRLRQAAYAMLSPQERSGIHRRIGRAMLKASRSPERSASLFALVNHLNAGRLPSMAGPELAELAGLNALAGRKAMSSTAFKAAADYFEAAEALLAGHEGALTPAERFSLSLDLAESVFLSGDLGKAGPLAESLLGRAATDSERASAYKLKSRILEFKGDLSGAIGEIRKGLSLFGLRLPEAKDEIGRMVGEGLGRLRQGLARITIEALLGLGAMEDEGSVIAMRLLAQVVPAAIQYDYALYMVATLTMMDLTLARGTTPESCKCVADCGIICASVLGDVETGYLLGKAAFALMEKLRAEWQRPAVCFSFTYVSHMVKHYREGLEYYELSYRSGLQSGDTQHAAYARAHKLHLMVWTGSRLRECREETESAIAFLKESQALVQLMLANIVLHSIKKLQLVPDSLKERELEKADSVIMAAIGQTENMVLLVRFSQYNAFLHFLLGEMEAAGKWNATAQSVIFASGTDFPVADHYLVQSLLAVDRVKKGLAPDRDAEIQGIRANIERLKAMAAHCAENFAHKHLLLSAELSALLGESLEETLGLYKAAQASIGKGDFIQMAALVNESQGVFWIGRGDDTIARAFLREAHYLYGQWGAFRKCAQMERAYRDCFILRGEGSDKPKLTQKPGTDGSQSNADLDISSIVKSTQTISGEIKTERLLRILLQTIIENAGAQSGCLLLPSGEPAELFVAAQKASDSDAVEIVKSLPYGRSGNLCREMVEYVRRTWESLVLDDAAADGKFRHNDYVRERKVKSVLCMPVIHQNELKGIVYLENNLSDHVFSPERMGVLGILASQASISIENARLYEDMEGKVRERTKLLHEANEKLRQLTLIDPLTLLNNRRYFHDYVAGMAQRYLQKRRRSMANEEHRAPPPPDSVMGLFLIDIDHFKEVNDAWGHAAGDAALVTVSKALKSIIRADDCIVRWGGEEFLVLLSDARVDYLERFARRVLQSVAEAPIAVAEGKTIRKTCSIGFAQFPFCGESPDFLSLEQTIKVIDCAMYVAKRSGRNRAIYATMREGQAADDEFRDRLLSLKQETALETDIVEMTLVV
jgi:diguanylate cyclase (GGDEF)-like protein